MQKSKDNRQQNNQQNNINNNEPPINVNDGSLNNIAPKDDVPNSSSGGANNEIKTNSTDSSAISPAMSIDGDSVNSDGQSGSLEQQKPDNSNESVNDSQSESGSSGSSSGFATKLGIVSSSKDAAQTANNNFQNFYDNGGDIYADEEDGVSSTLDSMNDVAVGGVETAKDVALTVGKATAGDVPGAVKSGVDAFKDVLKIIPSLFKLLIPLVIVFVLVISIFLQSSAMLWKGLSDEYKNWSYNKAVSAINAGIDDAAFRVEDAVSGKIASYFGETRKSFKKKCNQYYEDYLGNGYTREYKDGSSLSIELKISSDGQHEDAYITYVDGKGEIDTVVFKSADASYSQLDTDISYAQIISAFNLYREKKAEEDGAYHVYHTFSKSIDDKIKSLREKMYGDGDYDLSQFLGDTENLLKEDENEREETQPLSISPEERSDPLETWGLADTGALYYYMTHDENLVKSLYDYEFTNESGEKITNLKGDKSKTSVGNNSYKVTLNISHFENNDQMVGENLYYSTDVMKGFGITEIDDIEKVVNNANIANILVDCAVESQSQPNPEFQEFITFSQPKILFEKIIGGPSVIEKIIDAGIYGDWSEAAVRRLMASYASAWINRSQAISNTDETFFFRTKDEFVDSFEGTSAGWEYDAATGTYKQSKKVTFNVADSIKYLGEDGMFMTYLFSKTLNAGMLQQDGTPLKPRTYIFPENYPKGGNKEHISQLYSSQDYYYYFQQYGLNGSNTKNVSGDTAWYQLTDFTNGPNVDAWDTAFNKQKVEESNDHVACIQKGDLIFLTYFNASLFNKDSLKDMINKNFSPFYGNKGYQVGLVTNVNYEQKKLTFAIYNYDDDPIKEGFLENTFDSTIQKYVGKSSLKVTEITVSYTGNGQGIIEPDWNDVFYNNLERINNVLKEFGEENIWQPNPLTFIVGYGKPNYAAYADELNKRLEIYREQKANSIAQNAVDLGGGTLGYPLSEKNRRITNDYSNGGHQGIDYGIPVGTPVYAADDGIVIKSMAITEGGSPGRGTPARAPNGKLYRSYGEVIEIQHDAGIVTYYAHLSKRLVERGTKVNRGQLIGYSGNTGNSSGPHLHFEVRKNGTVVNPHDFMSDSVTQKHGNYTYQLNTYITNSPVDNSKINVTFYCPGSCCNGSNAGTTAMGFKIQNVGKYYDTNQAYVACNWLPLGTKIRIDFGSSTSMGWFRNQNLVYTVVDTGSASRLSKATIDVLVPNDHKKTNIGKGGGKDYVKIKILSLGNK